MRSRVWLSGAALLCAILAAAPGAAYAGDPPGKRLDARRSEMAIHLDGRLDELAWRTARAVEDFHQLEPGEFDAPSERTEVRILYDDRNLYIGVDLHMSDPGKIVARRMVQGASIGSDDRFVVVIDTNRDHRNAYYFEINPHGLRGDGLIENNSRLIEDWEGLWYVATRIHEGGWTAEIAIPFSTLGFDADAAIWGINFFRDIRWNREVLAWSSRGRVYFPFAPATAGELHGIGGINQGLGLEISPSLLRTDGDADDWKPALDLRYRITPSLTSTFTWNTDFTGTTVDERQVNLTRFSLFFPERRRFFLEDAGIFEFGNSATSNLAHNGKPFFSRRIGLAANGMPVDILGGAKLSGHAGPWNVGLIGVRQEGVNSDDVRDLTVVRISRNVLANSSLGAIYTRGDPYGQRENQVLGTDFRYRTNTAAGRVVAANLWGLRSGDDGAWGVQVLYPNDHIFGEYWYADIGEHFDPALGFVNRAGIRHHNFYIRFRNRVEHHRILAHEHALWWSPVRNRNGDVQSDMIQLSPWMLMLRTGDVIRPRLLWNREVLQAPFRLFDQIDIPAGDYRYTAANISIGTSRVRPLAVTLTLEGGGFYDGTRRSIRFWADLEANPRLSVSGRTELTRLSLPGGDVRVRLHHLNTTVALSPRWAWMTVGQFDNVSGQLGVNSRLRWLPRAGNELAVVLNYGATTDDERWLRTENRELRTRFVYTLTY